MPNAQCKATEAHVRTVWLECGLEGQELPPSIYSTIGCKPSVRRRLLGQVEPRRPYFIVFVFTPAAVVAAFPVAIGLTNRPSQSSEFIMSKAAYCYTPATGYVPCAPDSCIERQDGIFSRHRRQAARRLQRKNLINSIPIRSTFLLSGQCSCRHE